MKDWKTHSIVFPIEVIIIPAIIITKPKKIPIEAVTSLHAELSLLLWDLGACILNFSLNEENRLSKH